jgi:glycosyltransferase involved in cell wall biosynthesis
MEEGERPFFSIVVPAHNEGKYIEDTLHCLMALEYPQDRFEVIVVENGSTDDTQAKAERFAKENVTILSYPGRGVSFARNRGLEAVSSHSMWVILLDADTHLAPEFLNELSAFLAGKNDIVVGGTSVTPFPATPFMNAWYRFYDGVHELFKHTATITIARYDIAKVTRFVEGQTWMEDLQFVRDMKRQGRYFFMHTNAVATSTRRFAKDGWFRTLFWQTLLGILPSAFQRRFSYSVVR